MLRFASRFRQSLSVGSVLLLASLSLCPDATAQAVRGTLLGSIVDSGGGAVPGANVTATDQGTNISSTTVTN